MHLISVKDSQCLLRLRDSSSSPDTHCFLSLLTIRSGPSIITGTQVCTYDFIILKKQKESRKKIIKRKKKKSHAQLIMLHTGWKPREPKETRFAVVTAHSALLTLTSYCLLHTPKRLNPTHWCMEDLWKQSSWRCAERRADPKLRGLTALALVA